MDEDYETVTFQGQECRIQYPGLYGATLDIPGCNDTLFVSWLRLADEN
jgi:hypothetical protein